MVGFQGTVLPAFFVGLISCRNERYKEIPDVLEFGIGSIIHVDNHVIPLFIIDSFFYSIEEYAKCNSCAFTIVVLQVFLLVAFIS